jgi:chaperonin cofactor prefoldin
MNNIGNKQFLDEIGLRHVFTLIKDYFNKYVSKEEFIKSELTISESLNDLNERIENIDVTDTSGFVTNNQLDTEVQILNDKIDNLDIKSAVTSVNGQTGDVIIDTSKFVTNEQLETEVQTINNRIDNLPTGTNLQAGNNITINEDIINAEGYKYEITSTGAVSLTLNYGGDNVPSVHNAGGDYSTVCGYNCKTTNGSSSANSFCGGDNSIVSNEDCFVYGKGLKTNLPYQTVFGKYNTGMPGWNDKPALEVGYGENDANRATVFVCNKNGYCASVYGFGTGTGSDFAEYFEWYDGNPNNEDRIGYMVQLNGDKIEISTAFTHCIGIVTGTEAFIGDSASIDWHNRYLKDEYGRIIYRTNEAGENIPVQNPDYNSNQVYIPRMQRKEWSPIGLVGKVHVRQDGTLKVGGFAGCKNGIATDATKGYRVLSIINENIALVLVK